MPYLNLDPDYFDHPKVARLRSLLGRDADVLPVRLLCFCAKYFPATGVLSGLSLEEIESRISWRGKAGQAVEALVESGILEHENGCYRVHGWKEHQGHIHAMKVKASNAAKARWKRMRSNAQAMLKQSPFLTVPDPSEPIKGSEEVTKGKPPPGNSLFGDFPAEAPEQPRPEFPAVQSTEAPKADDVPGEDGPGWRLWVKAWDGKAPVDRHLEPANARSLLERKAKDANVAPRLEGAMRAFKANGQIRNKTLANFLDQGHFNACLSKAHEFGGQAERKRLADIRYCQDWLARYVRDGQRAASKEEVGLVCRRAEFLQAQRVALPDGFRMPESI